jgi:anti-anti-sigma factor
MATPLALSTDRGNDGIPRVVAAGEIDLSNIDAFTEALAAAVTDGGGALTVDLAAVRYLDSAGINVLFAFADQVDRMRLIVHPLLMRVLTISGLTELAAVEPAPVGSSEGVTGQQ